MHWNTDDLVDTIATGLQNAAQAADLEHALASLDAHNELGLHPFIHRSLAFAGHGVWPEVRYPADRQDGRRNRGRRCDVVLTPDRRPLCAEPEATGALFLPADLDPTRETLDAVAEPGSPFQVDAVASGPPVALEDAYWMEVKTVMQFTAGGAHRGYTQRLLQAAAADVMKISADPLMVHAGLLLVVFAQDETVARHDVAAWHSRCVERDHPVGFPATAGFALNDRIGNGHALVSLFPVR